MSNGWTLEPSSSVGFKGHQVVGQAEKAGWRHHTEHLVFHVPTRYGFINIHDHVEDAVERSDVLDGTVLVSAMHITAGIYVNDAEGGLLQDMSKWIEGLAPFGPDYLHHRTGEDNGDAHMKSYLTHHQVVVPITGGKLDLGTWQQVFYAEFDGRRDKRLLIKVMGMTA